MADRRELDEEREELGQWDQDVGSRERGPDERAHKEANPTYPRKPGEPTLLTRQRAFEEEFAAIQVRRFRLPRRPEPNAEAERGPDGDPQNPPPASPEIDVSVKTPFKALRPFRLIDPKR